MINVNEMHSDGYSPLMIAIGHRNHAATALLMAAGANPDQRHPKDGSTPLTLAANSGDLAVMGILLGHDMQTRVGGGYANNISASDPLVRLPNGATALHIASLANYPEIVRMLMVATGSMRPKSNDNSSTFPQAFVNQRGAFGMSALYLACHAGNDAVVRVLLGFPPKPMDSMGEESTEEETLKQVFDTGVFVDLPGPFGVTPLMAAVQCGHAECGRLLLAAGADPDQQADPALFPCNAVSMAAFHANVGMLRKLLSRGATVDRSFDPKGNSSAMRAAFYSDFDVLHLLVEAGANCDELRNEDGQNVGDIATLLHQKSLDQVLRSGKRMLQLEAEDLSRHKSHAAIAKRRRILAGSQFRQFDADGDDSISRTELEAYLRSHTALVEVFERSGHKGFQHLVDTALRRSDTSNGGDADGRISMEEFQVVFAMIDRFMKMQLCLEQIEASEEKAARFIQKNLKRLRR